MPRNARATGTTPPPTHPTTSSTHVLAHQHNRRAAQRHADLLHLAGAHIVAAHEEGLLVRVDVVHELQPVGALLVIHGHFELRERSERGRGGGHVSAQMERPEAKGMDGESKVSGATSQDKTHTPETAVAYINYSKLSLQTTRGTSRLDDGWVRWVSVRPSCSVG